MEIGTPLCHYKSFEFKNRIILCMGDVIRSALSNGNFEASYEVCYDFDYGQVIFKPLEKNSEESRVTLDLTELEEEHGDNLYIIKRAGVKYDKH